MELLTVFFVTMVVLLTMIVIAAVAAFAAFILFRPQILLLLRLIQLLIRLLPRLPSIAPLLYLLEGGLRTAGGLVAIGGSAARDGGGALIEANRVLGDIPLTVPSGQATLSTRSLKEWWNSARGQQPLLPSWPQVKNDNGDWEDMWSPIFPTSATVAIGLDQQTVSEVAQALNPALSPWSESPLGTAGTRLTAIGTSLGQGGPDPNTVQRPAAPATSVATDLLDAAEVVRLIRLIFDPETPPQP